MVLNFYNPDYGITKKKEWELWRETCLLAWRGTHAYGLSAAMLRRGYKVTLIRESKRLWKDVNFPENNDALEHAIHEQEKEARELGLEEIIIKDINLQILSEHIENGIPPIVLTREIEEENNLGFAHWVVVTEVNDNYVVINDPHNSGDRKVSKELFLSSINEISKLNNNFSKDVIVVQK